MTSNVRAGGTLIPYNLKEDNNWGLNVDDLRQAAHDARERGLAVRGLVFINPGNPTGQCLSIQNLQEIIQFCHEEGVVLMADEVYQENVYQVRMLCGRKHGNYGSCTPCLSTRSRRR